MTTKAEWESEAQEWMDKLNILDIEILNSIVYHKLQARTATIIERLEGLRRKEGKHDGHRNDDASWCYDCKEGGNEEDFTNNWLYNAALDLAIKEIKKI